MIDTHWSVWADVRYATVSDRRNGMDIDGETSVVSFGADRRLSTDLVMGMMASFDDSRTHGFDRDLRVIGDGFSAGPYFGYRITNRWALDGVLAFGRVTSESRIAIFNTRYTSRRYSAALTLNGQFVPDELLVRPRLSITYSRHDDDDHDMSGSFAGMPVVLRVAGEEHDYGMSEIAAEVSGELHASARAVSIAYIDVGLRYEFERPDDGKVLTRSLVQVSTSPWAGSVRTGLRSVLSRSTLIEATASYLSVGHAQLDQWEFRLFASHGF